MSDQDSTEYPRLFFKVEELTTWRISLTTGDIVTIYASAYSVEDNEYVFDTLIKDKPPKILVLARIPVRLVSEIESF